VIQPNINIIMFLIHVIEIVNYSRYSWLHGTKQNHNVLSRISSQIIDLNLS